MEREQGMEQNHQGNSKEYNRGYYYGYEVGYERADADADVIIHELRHDLNVLGAHATDLVKALKAMIAGELYLLMNEVLTDHTWLPAMRKYRGECVPHGRKHPCDLCFRAKYPKNNGET